MDRQFAPLMLSAILLVVTITPAVAQDADLMITSVFHGPRSGLVPKGVELYARQDIPDLSVYGVEVINNGAGAKAVEIEFPERAVSKGDFIYIESTTVGFEDYFGDPPDYAHFRMSVSGDDAVALYHGGVIVDIFGDPDTDGTGEAWEYSKGFAYRKSYTGPNGGAFDVTQFDFSGVNALDGCSTNSACATQIPLTSYSETVFPVTWTAFTATAHDDGALLSWSVATQRDNDYFAVEVSQDGDGFTEVGRVSGSGTTNQAADYSYDYLTDAVGLHYFRLRQVDFDGSSSFSEVVSVQLGGGASGLRVTAVPGQGGQVLVTTASPARLTVANLTGAVVWRHAIGSPGTHVMSLEHLPSGVYVISDGTTARRFIR